MESHTDEFGRLHVSREDYERLTVEWNKQHGMPTDSGHVIAREQWIERQVSAELHWPVQSC